MTSVAFKSMKPARLAWGLAALALLLMGSAIVCGRALDSRVGTDLLVLFLAVVFVFAVLGGLIASRHPKNAIGWIFLGIAVSEGVAWVIGTYADYWVKTGVGPESLGRFAAWYTNISWMPLVLIPPTFLVMLFPNGQLLSRRWRLVAWSAGLGLPALMLATGLNPGPLSEYPKMLNPYGVESPLLTPFAIAAGVLTATALGGSAVSLILRFRRARGQERQQVKWLAFAGAVAMVVVPVMTFLYDQMNESLATFIVMSSVLGLPIAAGVAILKYRLYDIDVVINRALVYGALTAMLAGAYLGSVLLFQLVLSSVTQGSGLAVAASTLATAALVRPARSRIQDLVDRRFFRKKYDAARTLERFSTQMRDQVDLADIGTDLLGVVTETVQPAHASLWLATQKGVRP